MKNNIASLFRKFTKKINRALDIHARMCYNINVEAETACRKVWSLLMKHTLHLSESSVAADGSLFHFGFYVYQYREHKAQNTADRSNIWKSKQCFTSSRFISRESFHITSSPLSRDYWRQTVCRLPFSGTAGFHLLILYHKHEYFSTFCEIFFLSHCHSGDFVL